MDGVKQKRVTLKKKTLNNPFSFIDDHILAPDLGPRFVNSIFIPFIRPGLKVAFYMRRIELPS